MTAFVGVRAETHPNYTGLGETPDVCVGVAEMLSVWPRRKQRATRLLVQFWQDIFNTIQEKETLEVVGSIMARPF